MLLKTASILTALSVLLLQQESSFAFTPTRPLAGRHTILNLPHSKTMTASLTPAAPGSVRSPISVVSMMVDSDEETTNSVRVEPGTHEELMYILGINLARQLGDIRPLVENGEELAQVAKGLLDTVVGRLDEDGQRKLLSSRGKELDELVMTRA